MSHAICQLCVPTGRLREVVGVPVSLCYLDREQLETMPSKGDTNPSCTSVVGVVGTVGAAGCKATLLHTAIHRSGLPGTHIAV